MRTTLGVVNRTSAAFAAAALICSALSAPVEAQAQARDAPAKTAGARSRAQVEQPDDASQEPLWGRALDGDYLGDHLGDYLGDHLDRGLGFLRQFREPDKCKDTLDEMAGAVTSLSPDTWGAVIGLAVGVAAGAASTGSVMGALRGGILAGSIGSALGHLADVLIPERVAQFADDLQDLIQARDGKVCQLVRASDRLRAPVVEHLSAALSRECRLVPESDPEGGPSLTAALRRCVRDNPAAGRIFESHVSVLRTINEGTCRVAATVVHRFDRVVAEKAADSATQARAFDELLPICYEDDEPGRRVEQAVPAPPRQHLWQRSDGEEQIL